MDLGLGAAEGGELGEGHLPGLHAGLALRAHVLKHLHDLLRRGYRGGGARRGADEHQVLHLSLFT